MRKTTNGSEVVCPLAPELAASEVTQVRVFRHTPHPTKKNAPPVKTLMTGNFDWNDDELSIGEACGEGTYVVMFRNEKEILAWSEPFNVAPSRRSSKGILNTNTANETTSGWVTIPGLSPATNAMLAICQQRAFEVRDDANKQVAAMVELFKSQMLMMTALVGESHKESASIGVFRSQFEKVLVKLEERDKQLVDLERKSLGLEVKAKNKEPEQSTFDKILNIAGSPVGEKILGKIEEIAQRVGDEVAEEGKRALRERIAQSTVDQLPTLNEETPSVDVVPQS